MRLPLPPTHLVTISGDTAFEIFLLSSGNLKEVLFSLFVVVDFVLVILNESEKLIVTAALARPFNVLITNACELPGI